MRENPGFTRSFDCIDVWAERRPDAVAMIQHEDGRHFTYRQFSRLTTFFALKLLDMGITAGDRVATQLVLVPEHLALMYACFRIGAIFAPLDVRLSDTEVVRDINKIRAAAFFFLGKTPVRDFRTVGKAVHDHCSSVIHLIQMTPDPAPGDIIPEARGITSLMNKSRLIWLKLKDLMTGRLKHVQETLNGRTPALIIYTTGTTGEPKPAVLCHENILVQNRILERGIDYQGDPSTFTILVNLPPSHVGCITETLMTTLFMGGKAVLLRIFDVGQTLEAIQKHRIKVLGMIPTMYRMLWNHPDYETYDLSSLEFAAYAGAPVDLPFLKKLAAMAPNVGTGLGMTENAGFATFTLPGTPAEAMVDQVGQTFPDLADVTVRKPMNPDGSAGDALPDEEIGEICYHPPIVFLGYWDQPEETRKTVSTDGILYTGDIGCFRIIQEQRSLCLAGRRKFIIKQKGYNVFPGEVEAHIAQLAGVDIAEVIGMKHALFDEGIVAFVRPCPGSDLSPAQVNEHCRKIAAYKRPQHVEIWPHDKELPLTRSAKVDKLQLKIVAEPIINDLRKRGAWDARTDIP